MSASAKASRANLVIRSMKEEALRCFFFAFIRIARLEKAVAKQRNSRWAVSAAMCVSASAKASRASLVIRSTRKKERRWGTLRKEGAPTALHLTPFRIVLSQSDARYPYGLGDVCFVLFVYNFFVPSWNGFCHIIIPT